MLAEDKQQALILALADRVFAQSELLSKRADRMPGNAEYLKLLDDMRDLHISKSADYGKATDTWANFRNSAKLGVEPWVGAMIRAEDKLVRIESLIQNGSLKNESVEDSLMDLAAYALIALVLRREATSPVPPASPPVRNQ